MYLTCFPVDIKENKITEHKTRACTPRERQPLWQSVNLVSRLWRYPGVAMNEGITLLNCATEGVLANHRPMVAVFEAGLGEGGEGGEMHMITGIEIKR